MDKKNIVKGLLFYAIAFAAILLTIDSPVLIALLVPAAAGFLIAGSYYINFSPLVIAATASAVNYILYSNMWCALAVLCYSIGTVLILRLVTKNTDNLCYVVGWTSLVNAVLVGGVFVAYLYFTNRNIDMSVVTDPIREFGDNLIAFTKDSISMVYSSVEVSEENIGNITDMVVEVYSQAIETIIDVIPAIFISIIVAGTYIAHIISKGLSARISPRPVTTESIFKMRIPAIIGLTFMIAYAMLVFVEGQAAVIAMNYVAILEIPLTIEGACAAYGLITTKWNKTWVKIVCAVVIIFVLVNFMLNMSWLLLCFGIMDTYSDFRGRAKRIKK